MDIAVKWRQLAEPNDQVRALCSCVPDLFELGCCRRCLLNTAKSEQGGLQDCSDINVKLMCKIIASAFVGPAPTWQ